MTASTAKYFFSLLVIILGLLALVRSVSNCFVIVCLSLAALLASTASAHNVVSGVYADGMLIEGEVGFSNGDMAEAGSPVKVYNASDELIAELVLDKGGAFAYQAKTATKHLFKANLSAGHVAEMVVEADELTTPMTEQASALANIVDKARQQVGDNGESNNTPSKTLRLSSDISVEQLQSIVRSAVAQQVKPLQKELRAYKEKVMFRDITGGLGFIFGLFGVAAWMASKRKEGENSATVS